MGSEVRDDAADLERLASGDVGRFWTLWDRHRSAVERVCRRRLALTPVDWQDAVQETLVRAWHSIPVRAAQVTDVRGWLVRLAVWVCTDQLRTACRQASITDAPALSVATADLASDPQEVLARSWDAREVLLRIDRLPTRLRRVCVAHFIEEQSLSEVAVELNTTERAVRDDIRRARRALREAAPAWPDLGRDATRHRTRHVRVISVRGSGGRHIDYRADVDGPLAARAVRIGTLRKHCARFPSGWKRRLELANLLFATGNLDESIEHLKAVAQKVPERADVLTRLAEALELAGRSDAALDTYDRAARAAHDTAQSACLRGLRARLAGDDTAAVAELTLAARLSPSSVTAWHILGETHERMHRYADAVAAFDRALAIDPDDTVALVRSHNGLCALGRYPEMLRRLDRAIRLDPNNVVALKLLAAHRAARGRVYGQEGKVARRLLDRAMRLAPDAADVWETLAQFHLRRGEWDPANSLMARYTRLHRRNARGWYHRAMVLLQTGRPRAARIAASCASSLAPDWMEPAWLVVNVQVILGNADALQRLGCDLVARFPTMWDAYTTAGLALVRGPGRLDEGCALARQGVAIAPEVVSAWLRYAEVLEAAGRGEELVAALRRAWDLLPGDGIRTAASVSVHLSTAYAAIGDDRAAQQWAAAGTALAERLAAEEPMEGRLLLAQAHQAAGNVGEAVRLFRAFLDTHPPWPVRREALIALRTLGC